MKLVPALLLLLLVSSAEAAKNGPNNAGGGTDAICKKVNLSCKKDSDCCNFNCVRKVCLGVPGTSGSTGPVDPCTDCTPCPAAGESIELPLNLTTVKLAPHADGLCTLVEVNEAGDIRPMARSYSNREWSGYTGSALSSSSMDCTTASNSCTLTLPTLLVETGASYFLTSYPARTLSTHEHAARFLEKTTFGPTLDEINAFTTGDSYLGYLQDQFSQPMTSHRAFFRHRATHWHGETTYHGGLAASPCQVNARYRKYAFTITDKDRWVNIVTSGTHRILSIAGYRRTVLTSIQAGGSNNPSGTEVVDGDYQLCGTNEEGLGGRIRFNIPGLGCVSHMWFDSVRGNPPVLFNGFNPDTAMLDLNTALYDFAMMDFYPNGEIVQLTSDIEQSNCLTYAATTGNPEETVVATLNEEYWIHTPTWLLLDNDLDTPLMDGGKEMMDATADAEQDRMSVRCSNTPRTFLNEDTCVLSTQDACSMKEAPDVDIDLTIDTLALIHSSTGGGAAAAEGDGEYATRYVYVVNDLRQSGQKNIPPCTPAGKSRWVPIVGDCSAPLVSVAAQTQTVFEHLIRSSPDNQNHYLRDIFFPVSGTSCDANDVKSFDFQVLVDGQCWQNTHVDNWNVFDFTYWTTDAHPGNSAERNPIKEFAELTETFTLKFPDWHSMGRWDRNRDYFPEVGRFNDTTTFRSLPGALFRDDIAQAFGASTSAVANGPSIVCGSPFEVANNNVNNLDAGILKQGGFDIATRYNRTSHSYDMEHQRESIWMEIALKSTDTLRQRMAWALSQILVISPGAIRERDQTESFVGYYDIFVRHAFGNYFNILKEVTYHPLMAEMLSYLGGRSTGYEYTRSKKMQFADENFAREIMQLFSIGLQLLNDDGTPQVDSNNNAMLTYTNQDITEYAKVYTGYQRFPPRGNIEDRVSYNSGSKYNQVDPLNIIPEYRDHLPKLGLNKQYIGDGYPLCTDLPEKHFLHKGATYRLLGSDPSTTLLNDPQEWYGIAPRRLSLDTSTSQLAAKICNKLRKNSPCRFAAQFVLDETISCTGVECNIDEFRVIEAAPGTYYEYVRQPCVHRAFYPDAKTIRRDWSGDKYMCGEKLTTMASTTCCDIEGSKSSSFLAGAEMFSGERVTYDTAFTRCSDLGKELCLNPNLNESRDCVNTTTAIGGCDMYMSYWSDSQCNLYAKIDLEGSIAIVHEAVGRTEGEVRKMVNYDTKMFFRVDWITSPEDLDYLLANYTHNCAVMGCELAVDGFCQCAIKQVTETTAFTNGTLLAEASVEEILSTVTIGAIPPAADEVGEEVAPGVTKYPAGASLDHNTVFEIVDSNWRTHYRKNIRSLVSIGNEQKTLVMRNPVSFISVADPNRRDAQYETDAALEHYFYHPNVAPFLATRLAQRFGISSPTPRYVKTIATAFRTGLYTPEGSTTAVGSGEYGCLQATISAVLLDSESQDSSLDADPVHGSLNEPFMKIVRLMRSLEFQNSPTDPFVRISKDLQDFIGQEPHQMESVFSYFKPEYQPAGKVAHAGQFSPEAQVLNGPSSVNMMNTMLSYIKYGHSSCYDGFGSYVKKCVIGNTPDHDGNNTYAPDSAYTAQEVVDELALLLTAGRLSDSSRARIEESYNATIAAGKGSLEAMVNVQQLIATTPEFHTNGLTSKTGFARSEPTLPTPTGKPYKAVVYVMLSGGYDSYNMLVPDTCSGVNEAGTNVRDQYDSERGVMSFNEGAERNLTIDATGQDQPCDTFVVHDELEIIKELYDNNELIFFANTGVINNNGMTKKNYYAVTKTQLFAHNAMQEEAKKVDPFDEAPGTGVLGRAKDILSNNGHIMNSLSIDRSSIALEGAPGQSSPLTIVGRRGVKTFNVKPSAENYFDLEATAKELNAETDQHSNIYGETWSQQFAAGVEAGKSLAEALDTATLDETIWFNEEGKQNAESGLEREHWEKWSTIFKLMKTRATRSVDRDIFFTEFGGWDHHSSMKDNIRPRFHGINHGLTLFVEQLKAEGLWENTAIVFTSDFARTITPNSNDGSDHAWGGHYFMMGGEVKGGKILGQYPYDITKDGPLNIGRGRMIPTTPWDAIWKGVIQWMGVEDADLDVCLPNANSTVDAPFRLFDRDDLFNAPAETPSRLRQRR